ncbi:MAG: tetratricopeptide repeat protein [Candidatus Gastranaerophilales bacterium]|nr:tetratricopeptide repeat protein [Candidatus Gastranaerophilales bacterium]
MAENLEELINQASKEIAESKWEQAIKTLNRACEIDAYNNEVLKNLGLCYYNLSKNTKAQEFFKRALGVTPDDATSLFYSGSINLLNLDFNTAKTQLHKVIELRPEYTDAYKNLGVVYFNLKQHQEAVNILEKGLPYANESQEYYRLLASAYIVSRQNLKAVELLEEFLKRNPIESYEIFNLLGSAHLGLKNTEKAREYYLKSVVVNERNEVAQKALVFLDAIENDVLAEYRPLIENKAPVEDIVAVAESLYRDHKINEAIGFLAYSLKNGYDDTKIYYLLSILYEAKGHFNDSLKCLHKIITTSTPTKEIELKIAKLFLQLSKTNEAFALLNKLIKKYPYDTDVYYEYAMAFVAYGDNIKAEEYLKKVIDMDPEGKLCAIAHKDLGCIYLGQNNMDYAKDEFQLAYDLAPEDDIICYEYASYHFISGDRETALKYYEKAINLNPYDDEYKVALALLYNNLKKYHATINLLMPIVPKVQRLPKLAYPLAVAFYETGQFDLAQKLFVRYCELTNDVEVYNLLALTYEKMGKYQDAISIANKMLKDFPDNINVLGNKARFLHKSEKFDEAEAIYLDILSKLSNYEEAIVGLVTLYKDSDQLHKAKDYIARLDYNDFSDEAVEIFKNISAL